MASQRLLKTQGEHIVSKSLKGIGRHWYRKIHKILGESRYMLFAAVRESREISECGLPRRSKPYVPFSVDNCRRGTICVAYTMSCLVFLLGNKKKELLIGVKGSGVVRLFVI